MEYALFQCFGDVFTKYWNRVWFLENSNYLKPDIYFEFT